MNSELGRLLVLAGIVLGLFTSTGPGKPANAFVSHRSHAIAMYREPKYLRDFKHFDYVEPDARKGGQVVLGAEGSFDSLNALIPKGQSVAGIQLLFESLTVASADEEYTQYGLLAETIEWPDDRSWVAFTLRPEARWHDGRPVTVKDVIWSLKILKREGHPALRAYYAGLDKAKKTGERTVKFIFRGSGNRELPLIAGQLPVLPEHYWRERDFTAATLDPLIGSGPYRIQRIEPGRSITYQYHRDYWGKDLPVNQGKHNFAKVRYDYYKDRDAVRRAFKAEKVDLFHENVAREWATGYEIPALQRGLIKKREIKHQTPQAMQGFVFNTRRDIFKDRQVRAALGYAFDFEWTNRHLFHEAYRRTNSYFANSGFASSGKPKPEELMVLRPYKNMIPPEVLEGAFELPKTDGSGKIDSHLRMASGLLKDAGWAVKDGHLTNKRGAVMRFEILLGSPGLERVVLPFAKNLSAIGVKADVRVVDFPRYQELLASHDFDMVIGTLGVPSMSPGNELRAFWAKQTADVYGTWNLAGVKDPVVDALVDRVTFAPDRQSQTVLVQALDRVLLWNHYVIPQWHSPAHRIVYWNKFGFPEPMPTYGLSLSHMWIDPELAHALQR